MSNFKKLPKSLISNDSLALLSMIVSCSCYFLRWNTQFLNRNSGENLKEIPEAKMPNADLVNAENLEISDDQIIARNGNFVTSEAENNNQETHINNGETVSSQVSFD